MNLSSTPKIGPGNGGSEAFMNGMFADSITKTEVLPKPESTTVAPVTRTVEKYKGVYTEAIIPEKDWPKH